MRRLAFALILALGICLGRLPIGSATHWMTPVFQPFVGVPVSATYLPTHIKRVQLRSLTLASAGTNNDTITSVNTTWSYLISMGTTWDVTSAFNATACFLTSATNVACKDDPGSVSTTGVANYAVIELYPGVVKSVQTCTISITNGNGTGTCTITSVSTTKSFLSFMGYRSTNSNGAASDQTATLVQTNATTITGTRLGGHAGNGEISVFVVEGK